jgi:hypothetical protein
MRTSVLLFPSLLLASCYNTTSRFDDHGIDTATSSETDTDTDTDSDSDTDSDTDTDTNGGGSSTDVSYALDVVKQGTMPDLEHAYMAMMSPTNNYTYILDRPDDVTAADPMIHFLLDSYIYPSGDYCIGTEDKGVCHGTLWTSGRLYNPQSPKPTTSFCIDEPGGRMFLVKDQGTRIEVADIAFEGDEAYTYNVPYSKIDLQDDVTDAGSSKYMGPCEYLPATDELLLTSANSEQGEGMQVLGASEDGSLHRHGEMNVAPSHVYALNNGEDVLMDDGGSPILNLVDSETLSAVATWYTTSTIVHFGVNRRTGMAYLAHGTAGAGMIDTTDPDSVEVPIDIPGSVEWAFGDSSHDLAWFVSNSGGSYTVYMVQDGVVVTSAPVPDTVVSVAEPSDMGDLVVFQKGSAAGSGSYTVFGARAQNLDDRPPLKIFLFTTIEEPSDSNMAEPCTGSGQTFESELNLVKANASRLAALGVPVAMSITDNFAQKSEECGVAADIYGYLDGLGFELGAMLHNRPCYNCSSGDTVPNDDGELSNPDFCGTDDANYISAGNGSACFPDDPEYCAMGDWDCYYAFLQPRAEYADENIPGGAKFIVGGDRHGMWEYDWIRFYQEVEREHSGKTGYDLTLFAGTWAYNNIGYDDPRGKNPTPWRPQERVAAWKPGDIDNWRGESAYSNLLYLPGINSASIKISEQQHSGLYMEDFFDALADHLFTTLYDAEDYEVQWTNMRQAVNYRQKDRVNTWYFHIHDNGIVNLGDASGADVLVPSADGTQVPAADLLQAFVTQVNDTYVKDGVVEWAYPSDIKAGYVNW